LQVTFSGLAKVAIFTTKRDAENQTLINHKCVCGALNRHFCQTRVVGSFLFFSQGKSISVLPSDKSSHIINEKVPVSRINMSDTKTTNESPIDFFQFKSVLKTLM
jgi:hypothetical protein